MDSKTNNGKDLSEEPRKKTGRIGPNPRKYDNIDPIYVNKSETSYWDNKVEEKIHVEPLCPVGFIHQNSSVTEICSDVDEKGFINYES